MTDEVLGASFRDPSGFVFRRDGVLHRWVARSYAPDYDQLMASGLYHALVDDDLLVRHEEVDAPGDAPAEAHAILRPAEIGFVSHPYEWCFSQLQDAALATLRVMETALRFDMTLKDASAYNIQFDVGRDGGRPIFIDTLSFERYREGEPWVAYRQFCQHFLAPLALMAYRDIRLGELLRLHLDGVPLDLARALLPARAWLDPHLLIHVRVHARYQRRYQGRTDATKQARPVSRRSLSGLLAALRTAVRRLSWKAEGTTWASYYEGDSYSEASSEHKADLVAGYLDRAAPRSVLDLGANVGVFSRLASDRGIPTVAFDVDPACVERSYLRVREAGDTHLLPLRLDLTNPSPSLGWAHRERASLQERSRFDAVMALALIHHLAIGNNVPLADVASWFASLGEHLIVEFVPKSDAKVQVLLATREDVFPDYTREGFEAAFSAHFELLSATPVEGSERALYLYA